MENSNITLERADSRFNQILKAFRVDGKNEADLEVNVEAKGILNTLGQAGNRFAKFLQSFRGGKKVEAEPELIEQDEESESEYLSEEEEEDVAISVQELQQSVPEPSITTQSKLLQISKNSNWNIKQNVFKTGHHCSNFGILTWSCCPLIPSNSIMSVTGISSEIKVSLQNFQFSQDKVLNVQRYAWLHLASGHSLIMIGHEKCGKSWSYIPIVCQRLYEAIQKEENPDWTGPICILVAASSDEGQILSDTLNKIFDFCSIEKMNLIVKLWDRKDLNEVYLKLSQPCGILITTGELMLKLHLMEKSQATIFHYESIRCLILDNLGDVWRHGPLNTSTMMKWLMEKFVFNVQRTQLIVTGRLWMEELMKDQLMPLLPDVLLVFEDGLEATVYGGIKLSMDFVTRDDYEEGQSLLKVLSGRDLTNERIVIVCYKEIECLKVHEILMAHEIPHFVFGNQQFQSKRGIIIAIDDLLSRLNIGPIDLLINYTLTYTWHRLKRRFNLFHANYKTDIKKSGEALIIFSPLEADQAWLFCDFLFKHNLDMPQNWLDHVHEYRLEKEKLLPRRNVNLCKQLEIYGNCYRRRCRYRHEMRLEEIKPANYLPTQGKIHFRILNCQTPANFCVNLVEDPYTGKLYKNPLKALGESIQKFYENDANLIRHQNPSIGDIIIIKLNKYYERVIIIGIKSNTVEVRRVDWGTEYFDMHINDIFVCDERFRHEKFEAIDVRITGIMPRSMDRIWSDDAKHFVRKKFFNSIKHRNRRTSFRYNIYTATIDFAFCNTVYVDTIFNEHGKDLKNFILQNLKAYEDKFNKSRLSSISANAQTVNNLK